MNRLSFILGVGLCAILVSACSPGMVRSSKNALGLFQTVKEKAAQPSKKLMAQSESPIAPSNRLDVGHNDSARRSVLDSTPVDAQWQEVDGYMILLLGDRIYVVPTDSVVSDDPA